MRKIKEYIRVKRQYSILDLEAKSLFAKKEASIKRLTILMVKGQDKKSELDNLTYLESRILNNTKEYFSLEELPDLSEFNKLFATLFYSKKYVEAHYPNLTKEESDRIYKTKKPD